MVVWAIRIKWLCNSLHGARYLATCGVALCPPVQLNGAGTEKGGIEASVKKGIYPGHMQDKNGIMAGISKTRLLSPIS